MRTAASWSGSRGTLRIQARGAKSAPPMASSPPTVTPASPLGRAAWSDISDRGASDERLTSRAPYKLAPGAACPAAVLLDQPLAGAAQLQARAIDQQVQRPAARGWPGSRHLRRLGPTAQGGMVRHGR